MSADKAYVLYGDKDFDRAEAVLRQSEQPPPKPLVPRQNLKRSAIRTSKSQSCFLAAVPLHLNMSVPTGCAFLTLDIEAALRLRLGAILVCEKLDTLTKLHQFEWLEEIVRGRPTLAVYLGNTQGVYTTETVLKLLSCSEVPVLGFFDLDPRGLSKAAELPRLEALCLPPREVLDQFLESYQPYSGLARQIRLARAKLDSLASPAVASAWALVRKSKNCVAIEYFPH
jgi:hypothetical protein